MVLTVKIERNGEKLWISPSSWLFLLHLGEKNKEIKIEMKEWAKSHKEYHPIPERRESLKKSSPKLKNKGSLNIIEQGEKEVSAQLFKAQIVEEEI